MNRRIALVASALIVPFTAFVSLSGCAPTLGNTIEAPQIPTPAKSSEARARLGSYVSIQSIEDSRPGPAANEEGKFTEPYGGVNTIVETGLKNAFREAGIAVVESAPVAIRAEIRKWRAQVNAKQTSAIDSEAAIYVELLDPTGKKIYSGTYNGSRASQFPVVTRIDVQDSLGLAMSNAIEQVISDAQLLELLGSF